MNRNITLKYLVPVLLSATLVLPAFADDQPTAAQEAKKSTDAEMMAKMMELAGRDVRPPFHNSTDQAESER